MTVPRQASLLSAVLVNPQNADPLACGVQGWNVARLDTTLSRTLAAAGKDIPGVSTAYLYFGTWRSVFAWCVDVADDTKRQCWLLEHGAGASWGPWGISSHTWHMPLTALLAAQAPMIRRCNLALLHPALSEHTMFAQHGTRASARPRMRSCG
jgi:hypothetical protein